MRKIEWIMFGLGGVMFLYEALHVVFNPILGWKIFHAAFLLLWSWWLYAYFGYWKIKKIVSPFFKPTGISPFIYKWPSPQYRVEADDATFYIARSGRLTQIIEPCIQNPEDHTLTSLRAIVDGDRTVWKADRGDLVEITIREYLDIRPRGISPEDWEALLRRVLGER